MAESQPATVLVVDDDELLRELLTMSLSTAGYPVLQAADGLEATQLLEDQLLPRLKACVILLDIMLPRLDGFGVLDYLKARETTMPVIAMSANPRHLAAAQAAGARAVVPKPFDLSELLSLVAADRDGLSSPPRAQQGGDSRAPCVAEPVP